MLKVNYVDGCKYYLSEEGIELVIDKDIDFVMIKSCYLNGCNCYNCLERVVEGCIIDDIEIEEEMEE